MTSEKGPVEVHRDLIVAETFGPTFQGEGPGCGTYAAFVRLSRCNLSCGWCDTSFTWDTARFDLRRESVTRTAGEVARQVLRLGTTLVVITGGEPLLQQRSLVGLVDRLLAAGRSVEVETNGTIAPLPEMLVDGVRFNVSPKLSNSGVPEGRRISADGLKAFASSGRAVFKFVATTVADLDEISDLTDRFGLAPVWVMPEGTTPEMVLVLARELADPVIARGWSLSLRQHILLWGDARGR